MKKGNGLYYVFTIVVYHFWNGTSRKNICMDTGILMSKIQLRFLVNLCGYKWYFLHARFFSSF